MDKEVIEFLKESNAIENEYSSIALQDAKIAWNYGYKTLITLSKPITIEIILEIHKRLLKNINSNINGRIRECAVYIGGECRDQSKEEIIAELNALCQRWNKRRFITGNSASLEEFEKKQKELFVKSWHVGFETTHFAVDGNGRTGRILMNLQRLSLGLPLLIIHVGKEQAIYYQWFRGSKEEHETKNIK